VLEGKSGDDFFVLQSSKRQLDSYLSLKQNESEKVCDVCLQHIDEELYAQNAARLQGHVTECHARLAETTMKASAAKVYPVPSILAVLCAPLATVLSVYPKTPGKTSCTSYHVTSQSFTYCNIRRNPPTHHNVVDYHLLTVPFGFPSVGGGEVGVRREGGGGG
jgi:hypothetical protein